MSVAAGTTRFTRPIASASDAVIALPVRIISIAFVFPTRRASRCVPANPGISPRLISGWPNRAVSAAIRQRARHGQLAAPAEREAVDGRDHRFAELLDEIEDVLPVERALPCAFGCVDAQAR